MREERLDGLNQSFDPKPQHAPRAPNLSMHRDALNQVGGLSVNLRAPSGNRPGVSSVFAKRCAVVARALEAK